ncbi:MAG: histidine phosphatase family protein [Sulfuricurvum sp.]|jgi:alpha-ribazole phosphatase/probable phosphoglycerate mutase
MELTLLRHAPPPTAYHGRYIGHTDIEIDGALFERDKIEHLLNQDFDCIYSSDLVRCTATLEKMGMTPFIADSRLREVCFKPSFEGKNFAQIEAMDTFDPNALDSKESWHRFVCDEPIEVFQARIKHFLNELPKEGSVLICTHGGTIQMILSMLDPHASNLPVGYLDAILVKFPRS